MRLTVLIRTILGVMLASLFSAAARSADDRPPTGPKQATSDRRNAELEARLAFQQGEITLARGAITLDLPAELRFLHVQQGYDVWQWRSLNYNGRYSFASTQGADLLLPRGTFGLICRSDASPLAEASYNVVVSYVESGFAREEGVEQIHFQPVVLPVVRPGLFDRSPLLLRHGSQQLINVPEYDRQSHTMQWAKECGGIGSLSHELWYSGSKFGRHGVLEFQVLTAMNELPQAKKMIQSLLECAHFNEGFRYGDYVSGSDKLADQVILEMLGGETRRTRLIKQLKQASPFLWLIAIVALSKWLEGRRASRQQVHKNQARGAPDPVILVKGPDPRKHPWLIFYLTLSAILLGIGLFSSGKDRGLLLIAGLWTFIWVCLWFLYGTLDLTGWNGLFGIGRPKPTNQKQQDARKDG